MSLGLHREHRGSSATLQNSPSSLVHVASQVNEPSEQDVADKPWKYVGYRGYSEFKSSDDDLLVFRRFSVLNTRILLSLQDKVCALEQELMETDMRYAAKDADDFHNGTFREDLPDRRELLEEIANTLAQYNALVLQQSAIRKYPTAPRRDIKNLNNWHYNHGDRAIAAEEREYTKKDNDLISIVEKDKTPLRRLVDGSQRLRTLPIWRQFSGSNASSYANSDRNVIYYSDKRIDNFASITIAVTGIAMLLTPIWILQALHCPTTKLVVITIFILVFLFTLSYAMVTKPFEALGATAAYAAVLMVFMQVGEAS
ncbi:hypothetical protein PG991_016123 [Apiospora marii]|uniref:DUF6594 domain-containing protein n=1 Tax=Apiospora marii TaxID=335849 RepID=A0ABR1R0P8_9PEZI